LNLKPCLIIISGELKHIILLCILKRTVSLMKSESLVLGILISIVLIGLVGIPFGDPRFIPIAVLLELVFIALAILVLKGYSRPLYICIVLASLIIIGNSITTAHIQRMMTFAKPVNTIVLIIGGYILQALLIYASAIAIMNRRRRRRDKNSSSDKNLAASHY
jgi:asparagine N-glycosylation enzyme membrane subunit Stt3